jgi:hypothetical protein
MYMRILKIRKIQATLNVCRDLWTFPEKFQDTGKCDEIFWNMSGSTITNGREPVSCLGRVFNFKLGSFT